MTDAAYARESIARGSKSFAAASRLLPPGTREDVARLYAWCRHCDDEIDGQVLGEGERTVANAAAILAGLRADTADALAGCPTGLPVFDGFGAVARRHGITAELANDLLDGFARDVTGERYPSLEALAHYAYGVAGAVGVMMALVLGVPPDDADTLDRAADLGLAFQMTNIARDVVADARAGRVYLPTDWLAEAGIEATPAAVADPRNAAAVFGVTRRLVEAAEPYYHSAEAGIARLPYRAAWAILAASRIYREIGMRRVAVGPEGLAERSATTRAEKVAMLASSAIAAAGRRRRDAYDRAGLWMRPPRP